MADGDGDTWVDEARAQAGPCPACGSVDVRPILYGYPMAEDFQSLQDVVEFAGCCIPERPASYRCGACGAQWGSWRGDDADGG